VDIGTVWDIENGLILRLSGKKEVTRAVKGYIELGQKEIK
jgi:hypothetical protein